MRQLMLLFAIVSPVVAMLATREIPDQLRGKWIVKKVIPTSTISCWGDRESKQLVGTEIEYTADSLRWRDKTTAHPDVTVSEITAEQFHSENSGGAADSQVSFRQLGILSASATQISLGHQAANITGGTTEIPGDGILIKSRNTIIVSVCNVYFEAVRSTSSAKSATATRDDHPQRN